MHLGACRNKEFLISSRARVHRKSGSKGYFEFSGLCLTYTSSLPLCHLLKESLFIDRQTLVPKKLTRLRVERNGERTLFQTSRSVTAIATPTHCTAHLQTTFHAANPVDHWHCPHRVSHIQLHLVHQHSTHPPEVLGPNHIITEHDRCLVSMSMCLYSGRCRSCSEHPLHDIQPCSDTHM